MRDDERRAALHQLLELLLDLALELRVERRSRLVEDQDRRIAQQRPRNRDALPLATRQQRAAVAHHGVEPARQLLGELVDAGRAAAAAVICARIRGQAEGDVAADRVVEQHDVLAHEAHLPAQVVEPVLAHVVPVEQDARRRSTS